MYTPKSRDWPVLLSIITYRSISYNRKSRSVSKLTGIALSYSETPVRVGRFLSMILNILLFTDSSLLFQVIKRALNFFKKVLCKMGVDRSCFKWSMTKNDLNLSEIGAIFQQMSCKWMSEDMCRYRFLYSGIHSSLPDEILCLTFWEWLVFIL